MIDIHTIPAAAVADLHEGAISVLGDVAEAILEALQSPRRELLDERLAASREQLERTCALLDMLIWTASPEEHTIRLAASAHRDALREASTAALRDLASDLIEVRGAPDRKSECEERSRLESLCRRVLELHSIALLVHDARKPEGAR